MEITFQIYCGGLEVQGVEDNGIGYCAGQLWSNMTAQQQACCAVT